MDIIDCSSPGDKKNATFENSRDGVNNDTFNRFNCFETEVSVEYYTIVEIRHTFCVFLSRMPLRANTYPARHRRKTSRIDYIALFSSCFLSETNDEQTSKTVLSRIPMGAMDSGSGGG